MVVAFRFSSARRNPNEDFAAWLSRMSELCQVSLYSTNTGESPRDLKSHSRKRYARAFRRRHLDSLAQTFVQIAFGALACRVCQRSSTRGGRAIGAKKRIARSRVVVVHRLDVGRHVGVSLVPQPSNAGRRITVASAEYAASAEQSGEYIRDIDRLANDRRLVVDVGGHQLCALRLAVRLLARASGRNDYKLSTRDGGENPQLLAALVAISIFKSAANDRPF